VAELALVSAPDLLWRVERTEPALAFSHVDVIDASSSSGNRFDVPGAGTLYASTSPAGAFAETLSRFRPRASLIEKMRASPASRTLTNTHRQAALIRPGSGCGDCGRSRWSIRCRSSTSTIPTPTPI